MLPWSALGIWREKKIIRRNYYQEYNILADLGSFQVLIVNEETPGYMPQPKIKSVVSHSVAADPEPVSSSTVKMYYQTPPSEDFICIICHSRYKSLGTMKNHLRVKHGQTLVIKCDKCNTVFDDAKALNRHTKSKNDCTKLPTS